MDVHAGARKFVVTWFSRIRRGPRAGAAAALAGGLALAFAGPAAATTFQVTNTNDSGAGSLREAISGANANNNSVEDMVAITATGTVELVGVLPDLENDNGSGPDLSIDGPGIDVFTVQRDSGGDYRIFTVASGAAVSISGLTATRGSATNGGGISNSGTLALQSVRVDKNEAMGVTGANGGGIHNTGALTGTDVDVTGNSLSPDAGGSGSGGGIRNTGTLTLTDGEVSANEAVVDGGAQGGGIYNLDGTVTLTGVTLRGNLATSATSNAQGAGIGSSGGQLTLARSVVDDNHATGTTTANSFGGGLTHSGTGAGPLTITDSTVSNNSLTNTNPTGGARGGGLNAGASPSIKNTTVSGNTVASGEGDGLGGGVSVSGGSFTALTSVTITDNGADAGDNLLVSGGVTAGIENTIVADGRNPAHANCVTGTIVSKGFNLEDGDSCSFDEASDQVDTDPLLLPLADNGGPTATHAISAASTALDAGDNATLAFAFDQRGSGFARVVDFAAAPNNPAGGDGTDVGAFELQVGPEGPPGDASCSDGLDNDENGAADQADAACQAPPGGGSGTPATPAGGGSGAGPAPLVRVRPIFARPGVNARQVKGRLKVVVTGRLVKTQGRRCSGRVAVGVKTGGRMARHAFQIQKSGKAPCKFRTVFRFKVGKLATSVRPRRRRLLVRVNSSYKGSGLLLADRAPSVLKRAIR